MTAARGQQRGLASRGRGSALLVLDKPGGVLWGRHLRKPSPWELQGPPKASVLPSLQPMLQRTPSCRPRCRAGCPTHAASLQPHALLGSDCRKEPRAPSGTGACPRSPVSKWRAGIPEPSVPTPTVFPLPSASQRGSPPWDLGMVEDVTRGSSPLSGPSVRRWQEG